jgi:hypothetical protein
MAAREDPEIDDPVLCAIDELASAVRANVEDERVLAKRLRTMRSRRVRGASTNQLLHEEATPTALSLLGRVLLRLGRASSTFRRTLAHELRDEGETVTGIARLFAVSHQRTSALLRTGRQTDSS